MSDDVPQDNGLKTTVNIDEWCSDTSVADRRVEALSAFAFVEKQAGHTRDFPAEFEKRYIAFLNKPA